MTKQALAIVTTATNTTTSFDTLGAFRSIAVAWYAADNALDAIKAQIEALREAGIKFGATKKCQHRTAMMDVLVATFGKSKSVKTLANYLTSICVAVNDGAEFSFSSSNGSIAGKGKAGGKKDGGKKAAPEFSTLVAKLFNHPDFETFCEAVQHNYDDAEAETMLGAVRVYLQAEGFEIAE